MKRQRMRRLLALLLTLAMVFTLVPGAYAQDEGENTGLTWKQVGNNEVSVSIGREEVEEPEEAPLYDADEQVRVSIVMEGEPTLALFSLASEDGEEADAMAYREELQAYQDAAAEYISEEALDDEPLDVVWNLTLAANIISANVEYGQIEAIKAVDGVEDVIVEQRYDIQGFPVPDDPNLVISTGMTHTADVWNNGAGYTGAGMRIAIIDTGLDIEHQSFNNDAFLHALEEDAEKTGKSYDLLDAGEIDGVLDQLNAKRNMPGVTAAQLYHNEKLPFGFCYVDKDVDVTHANDTQGDHGSHVAGIAAANRYLKKGDEFVKAINEEGVWMTGNAPDAQVLVMKVFGNNGGAYDSDYFAAIEDAIVLGCDTVNLSLGSGNAGMTTAGQYQAIMDRLAGTDLVATMSAGNNGYWAEQTSYGLPYSDDVNFHTGGSPGTFTNSLGVASVDNNGQVSPGAIIVDGAAYSYTETQGPNSVLLKSLDAGGTGTEYDYIFIDGIGRPEDFAGIPVSGKVAFCSRGETSFFEKANAAVAAGAIATVVYNNQPGTINMDLTDYTGTAPAVSITQADGAAIKAASTETAAGGKTYYTGRLTIKGSTTIAPGTNSYETMSDFSSWGVPGNLSMKPEITAPGGNIWSLLGTSGTHDEYQSMSGTSMAAPQIAGIGALVKQAIKDRGLSQAGLTDRALAQSLMMSTATPLTDADGYYYSILQQGAGLVDTAAAVNADSYILMDASATGSWKDGKVKAELGDDPSRNGSYSVTFTIHNLDGEDHSYDLNADVFTQYVYAEGFLDTSTDVLPANVYFSVAASDGSSAKYDFDGNGVTDLEDGTALLDYVTGKRSWNSLSNREDAYFGRNVVDSYSAYQFLQKMTDDAMVTVPANGSATVTANIVLDKGDLADLEERCPNGFYVEAYLHADAIATDEGAEGTSHSIPVLGFYGNWTDPTMFEKGSYVEYAYGLENRAPYLYDESDSSLFRNTLTVQYAGDPGNYYYGGNPYLEEDEYIPARNALNNENGDKLAKWRFTAIRNAAASRLEVRDVRNGRIYQSEELGAVDATFYYDKSGTWQSANYTLDLNWAGADANGYPLPEGTTVELSLTLAPELYVRPDGSVDWNALGEGASQKMQVTIDNTAPTIRGASYDAATKKLTVTARDNQYVAAMMVYNADGSGLIDAGTPNQTVQGALAGVALDLSGVQVGKKFLVQVCDYAGNATTYEFEQTITSGVDTYYAGYDEAEDVWTGYTADGSVSAQVGNGVSGLNICAGAYTQGYVFAFDTNNNFYAIDAATPGALGERTLIAEVPVSARVVDMAYNKADDTMYLLCVASGTSYLGIVDIFDGTFTPITATDGLCALAIDDEGTFYGANAAGTVTIFAVSGRSIVTGSTVANAAQAVRSMTWDSRKGELVLSAADGIYTVANGVLTQAVSTTDALAALFTPPADGEGTIGSSAEATSIVLSDERLTLVKGNSDQLIADIYPWNLANKDVTWSSSDPSVAAVDRNGVVTARSVGEATITATSQAAPYVTDTCEVEVITIDDTLQALVWDENGEVWWSSFNTSDLPNYTKRQAAEYRYASATMDSDGYIYAATLADGASTIYRIDPENMEAEYLAPMGGGFFIADMADRPLDPDTLVVASYYYLLTADKTEGSPRGWNLGEALNGANIIGIANLGQDTVEDDETGEMVPVDVYAFVTTQGDIYIIGISAGGSLWIFGRIPTGIITSEINQNSLTYAYDDDDVPYLFWSRFNGESDNVSELYAIDIDYTGACNYLGNFGAGVWPVAGLMSEEIPGLPASVSTMLHSGEAEKLGEAQMLFANDDSDSVEDEDISETVDIPDDLETYSMSETSLAAAGSTSASGRSVTVKLTADAVTTNGKLVITYDPRILSVSSTRSKAATLNSFNTSEQGKVVFAYASRNGLAKDAELAELIFTAQSSGDTTITVTTVEDGQTHPNTVEEISVTVKAPYVPTPGGGSGSGGSGSSGSGNGGSDSGNKPSDTTEPGDTTTQPSLPVVPDAAAAAAIVGQYKDLTVGSWYQEAVAYVVANNLMSGTGDGTFSPNTPMSRAMLVTVLHRAAGLPAASGSAMFNDVVSGTWYSDAVSWAASNAIVGGIGNGNFDPNGNVSRQELAVILWRYAQMLGLNVAADGTTMPDFADRGQIASWAGEAMAWAYRTGILTGDGSGLRPTDGASRVEAAAMLTRFMKLVENSRDPMK